MEKLLRQQFGLNPGGKIITDTAAHTGKFVVVQVLVAAVATVFTTPDYTGSLVGITLPAGFVFFGSVTAITLSGGVVVAVAGPVQG